MALLSIGNDAKTVKGERIGYLTGVQYLAPASVSGRNVCPDATPGCKADCLFTAGRGVFDSVREARIKRTRDFAANRGYHMASLVGEVAALVSKAKRDGLTPLVRLNGTSDLPWENIPAAQQRNVMSAFPGVQFYDYTKSYRRMLAFLAGKLPSNYHLTFSRSECNERECLDVLAKGGNVAVVFDTRKGQALPLTWNGYQVVDGDLSDVRPQDPGAHSQANGAASMGVQGHVIGLRAKGRARKDTHGFVVRTEAA